MDSCDAVIVDGAAVGSAAAFFLSLASVRHQFSTPENIRMSMFGSEFIAGVDQHLALNGVAPDMAWHGCRTVHCGNAMSCRPTPPPTCAVPVPQPHTRPLMRAGLIDLG